MRVHVRQYRPAFFEGFQDAETDVESAAQLLALDWIQNFTTGEGEHFYRFSISHPYSDYPQYHNLMAEYDNGRKWLVVANLQGDPDHELFKEFPKWHHP